MSKFKKNKVKNKANVNLQAGGLLELTRYDNSNRFSQRSTPTKKSKVSKRENKYGKNGLKRGDYAC